MKSFEFFNHVKSQFSLSEADMGSFPHRVQLEKDEKTGEVILPMPKSLYGDMAEVGDVFSFSKATIHKISLANLSCKVRKWTAFVREFTSMTRQLKSPRHPLNRMIFEYQGKCYLLKKIFH